VRKTRKREKLIATADKIAVLLRYSNFDDPWVPKLNGPAQS